MDQKKKRGRPPKPPAMRKRAMIGLRLRDSTKADLQAAAEANQRSLSEEAEARLEASFLAEALPEAVADAVIRRLAPLPQEPLRAIDIPLGKKDA